MISKELKKALFIGLDFWVPLGITFKIAVEKVSNFAWLLSIISTVNKQKKAT